MPGRLADRTTIELPVAGMDCAECVAHVEHAVRDLPGVQDVRVLLSTERATVSYDPDRVDRDRIVAAIGAAGYRVPASSADGAAAPTEEGRHAGAGHVIGWGVSSSSSRRSSCLQRWASASGSSTTWWRGCPDGFRPRPSRSAGGRSSAGWCRPRYDAK